ncbi:alpha/beta hydrolase family protein [Actinomadura kijaniata]|uniref:Acyl-CoA:diacylglycerol acyltransferase n=1 Tax=Actinomadura namibiensis TaxID=182080 RepID=A0A7W3LIN8_ACTNM|nr:alpha/beta hydrolase family protein [Actinomadura namibiensis]MBA8948889.1 S-formylglutathione hydrolase FrmB [Actinomadura namibiensis]
METRRTFCRTAILSTGAALGGGLLTGTADAAGARVVAEKRINARTLDLTVASRAMRRNVKVRLLLPRGWSRKARRTWPAVWALHGGNDRYDAWYRRTDIERLAARHQVIVVMPEGGYAGGYTDWWNYGRGGSPAWETFHLTELRGLLEARYRAGGRRAVIGQSSGGYGALIYAARHPGMFRFAASYSGFCSTLSPGVPEVLMTGLSGLGPFVDKNAMWGHPIFQRNVWAAHDPVTQASRLRGTRLYVSVARKGLKGPLDRPDAQAVDPAEEFCHYTTVPFLNRLRKLRIPVTTHLYAKGTHSWAYWQYELHRSWPLMMKALRA